MEASGQRTRSVRKARACQVTERILLTGGSGQLGRELLRRTWPNGLGIDAPPREELNLDDPNVLSRRMRDHRYIAVVNAGAYTQVDMAERDVAAAWQVNAVAPAVLAAACAELGIPLVQISTDYVFDGAKSDPWLPGDPIRPLSMYGASKAAGELAVRASGARHAILRTAWVFSANGHNFVRTMLRLAKEREEIGVVSDQIGSPTAADDLAAAVQTVVLRLLDDPDMPSGTWHMANSSYASWYELAEEIFSQAARHGMKAPRLKAIATEAYPTPAPRPANSRLDMTTLEADLGIHMPPWREAVKRIVDEILEGSPA